MTREEFLQRLSARAPTGAVAVGAALGIESYEVMLVDILDSQRETGPQAAVERLLVAVEAEEADLVGELVDAALAERLSGEKEPSAEKVCQVLTTVLQDTWLSEGWGFATAKRLHAPGVELVNLVRGGNQPVIAYAPTPIVGHLFYLRNDGDRWVLVDLDGPDPALAEELLPPST